MIFCRRTYVLGVVLIFFLSASAQADTISFSEFKHGEVLKNQLKSSHGLTVEVVNPNRSHNLGIIFDSTLTGTADDDLEGPSWAGGNLAPSNTVLGNLLIIAENNVSNDGDRLIDSPDDEGRRPAGTIKLKFDDRLSSFGLDIVDIEGDTAGEPPSTYILDFFLNSIKLAQVTFAEFIDPNSKFHDSTVVFGNNTANRINPIRATELGISGFDQVHVRMGGSGAIDNLVISTPAPPALILAALGLPALGFMARRRKKEPLPE